MQRRIEFSDLLQFFRTKPPALPGDLEYNAAFCKMLITASSAGEASIWQLDRRNQLHPIYGTNFTSEDVKDVYLREAEGIGGAVIISRQTMAVSQATRDARHDKSLDSRIGFQTHSMISAPILFGDDLFGVINILNHTSGSAFPSKWHERLSTVGVMYAAALAAAGRMRRYDESALRSKADRQKDAPFPDDRTIVVGVSCAIQEVLELCVKAAKSDILFVKHTLLSGYTFILIMRELVRASIFFSATHASFTGVL